jgi:hypothetical protein
LISEVHHFVFSRNLDLPVGAITARLFEALQQGEKNRLALKAYMLAGAKVAPAACGKSG